MTRFRLRLRFVLVALVPVRRPAPRSGRHAVRARHGRVPRTIAATTSKTRTGATRTTCPRAATSRMNNSAARAAFRATACGTKARKRGTPDVVKRVATPPGGIEGSTGALLFATKYSGIPGTISNEQQQDDLLMMFDRRLGRSISMSLAAELHGARLPAAVRTVGEAQRPVVRHAGRLPRPQAGRQHRKPIGPACSCCSATQTARASRKTSPSSRSAPARAATTSAASRSYEPGWWTLGMSFSPDGQIHYYASHGVDDLTADDYLDVAVSRTASAACRSTTSSSTWPTGTTAASWSTQWVIDDPKILRDSAAGPDGGPAVSREEAAAEDAAATQTAAAADSNSRRPSQPQPSTAATGRTQR